MKRPNKRVRRTVKAIERMAKAHLDFAKERGLYAFALSGWSLRRAAEIVKEEAERSA